MTSRGKNGLNVQVTMRAIDWLLRLDRDQIAQVERKFELKQRLSSDTTQEIPDCL